MRNLALPFVVSLFLLSSCASTIGSGGSNDDNSKIVRTDVCKLSYITPAGDFKTSAIEIPLGSAAGAATIKIGAVEYTHAQAQKLADAAQQAEQARASFCIATDPATFNQLSQQDKGEVVKLGLMQQIDLSTFASIIKGTTKPEVAVQAAQTLESASSTIKAKVAAIVPAAAPAAIPAAVAPAAPAPAPPPAPAPASAEDLKQLSNKMDSLTERLTSIHARDEIKVLGFDSKGLSLPAAERQRLFSQFQDALNKIPESQRPVVLIVGYATKSGPYLKNIDLGLRRAQTVFSFLQEQKFSRGYDGHVMSGGIDNSAYAQRVDIFITSS